MNRFNVIIVVAAVAALSGCASTQHARSVQTSGFLSEYRSLLEPGKEGEEAMLRYRNPKTDWISYRKILLKPVTIWGPAASTLSDEQREDLQRLVDSF
jgi:predicted transcriptional regulator